jgi:hypothetical protein
MIPKILQVLNYPDLFLHEICLVPEIFQHSDLKAKISGPLQLSRRIFPAREISRPEKYRVFKFHIPTLAAGFTAEICD